MKEKFKNNSVNALSLPAAEELAKDSNEKNFDKILNEENCENLLKNLSLIFSEDYKFLDKESERVINTMSLMNSIITLCGKRCYVLKPIVFKVIDIAKDRLDLLRKNAAILLAKIAKSSEEMEKFVRDLHGIEVIMNVAKFIKIDK